MVKWMDGRMDGWTKKKRMCSVSECDVDLNWRGKELDLKKMSKFQDVYNHQPRKLT
jgi:hypothetical protein